MEDLHQRAGSKRFWEEEQEQIIWKRVVWFCPEPIGRYGFYIPTDALARESINLVAFFMGDILD